MIRAALLAALVALPGAGGAQETGPRALALFAPARGYDDLPPERFGPPSAPVANELGLVLMLRMFRNVCLGLERGDTLQEVMPPDFDAYNMVAYMQIVGGDSGSRALVLSPTGDVDADEAAGTPTFTLLPTGDRFSCTLERQLTEDLPDDRQAGMAMFFENWLPYALALVRASRPHLGPEPLLFDAAEWDRPCGDGWCPLQVIYDLPGGYVSLTTTIDIATIAGDLPQ